MTLDPVTIRDGIPKLYRRMMWRPTQWAGQPANLLIVFELAVCMGMDGPTMSALNMADIGGHTLALPGRRVPLRLCTAAASHVRSYYQMRRHMNAAGIMPFLCSFRTGHVGAPLSAVQVRQFFATACHRLGLVGMGLSLSDGVASFDANAEAAGVPRRLIRHARGLTLGTERQPHPAEWDAFAGVLYPGSDSPTGAAMESLPAGSHHG